MVPAFVPVSTVVVPALREQHRQEDSAMTDKDVQREIEANEQRAREHEDEDMNEGGIVGAIDDLLDPFDGDDDEDAARERQQNDAEQRPDR
jgi:hypothetical protein